MLTILSVYVGGALAHLSADVLATQTALPGWSVDWRKVGRAAVWPIQGARAAISTYKSVRSK